MMGFLARVESPDRLISRRTGKGVVPFLLAGR
jgi:hypothetical protein